LLPALVGKGTGSQGKEYAVVVDVRGGHFFDELTAALAELKKNGSAYRLVFLDATDQALVNALNPLADHIHYKVVIALWMELHASGQN